MESPFQFHRQLNHTEVRRMPSRFRRPAIVVALLIAVFVIYQFVQTSIKSAHERSAKIVPVNSALVEARPMPVQLTAIGHVMPINSVAMRSRIDGQIITVAIEEGARVKQGDVLIKIDDRQAKAALDQASASLERDRAQLAFAQSESGRQQSLSRKEFSSRSQSEQAKTSAAALAATVAFDEAQVQSAQTVLSFTTLTAPIDGVVGSISAKTGTIVQANASSSLLTINQISPIYVAFSVPQSDLARVRQALAAGPVEVSAQPTGDNTSLAKGALAYFENAIDTATGTLGMRAIFPNENEVLWPGQFVEATVTLKVEPNALTVPATAVQIGQNGPYVFVVKNDSIVDMRPVVLARTVGDLAIISEGLAVNERVVTEGQLRLTPGAKVRLTDGQAGPKQKGSQPHERERRKQPS